jgi:chromosome segregation ATPase
MKNIINEQLQANKELINEIETLKKQLSNKEQEITELKNLEVSEQEEAEFKQEAIDQIHQILVDMKNRFPHCSKNIEQDLRKLISKPLRNQFMNVCFQHSLMHNYKWEGKENLEKVVERIIIDYFEDTELATELKKDWKLWNQRAYIFSQIEEGGEIFGRPAKDIILKDIIKSKVERIKDLEAEVEELEERVKIEQEQVKEVIAVGEKWSKNQAEDIKEKNKKLKSASAKISHLEAWVEKLEEESSQKSKKIEKLSKQLTDSETQNENLKNSFYLDNKPLPALPVEENKLSIKQNIFKQLKTKAKVKFQKLQRLIKKEKFHNQEMIAQVEVKSK